MPADSIRDLFSTQVERTPEAIAVTAGATRLTYLELDERSDRLARQLLALGVATDVPVAELCRMFSDTLGHPDLGIDDDFFELGGESLHAARLLGRIRTKFGVEITINVLFDISTVAGPAALIDATQSTAA